MRDEILNGGSVVRGDEVVDIVRDYSNHSKTRHVHSSENAWL